MTTRLLIINEYHRYFKFNQPETGCGIAKDNDVGDDYFFIQTFSPNSYFNINPLAFIANPFIRESDVPEQIHIRFELFAIGSVGDIRSFIFKPWIVNIDNPLMLQHLEDFVLFVPEKLFFNLVLRLIFLEQFSLLQLQNVRVFKNLSSEEFVQFGLHRKGNWLMPNFQTRRFSILYAGWKDYQKDIEKFYADNDCPIGYHLIDKYFRADLNCWYGILGINNSAHYGFIRLYNTNSSFTGGTSVEYIVSKKVRNKGVATEALKGLFKFLEEFSFLFSVSAEVKRENVASIRVLEKCNFIEQKSDSILLNDNYSYNIIDSFSFKIEDNFEDGNLEFKVNNSYMDMFSKYYGS